uniref:GPI inositol-deacylase n=1 Tax=Cyprinus carpio TaxID=7962 RepID=A0A8C1UF51_CYPCA
MRLAGYALYGFALGLLLVGLLDLLFGFGENRCSMTYMFEYPEYRRVQLPRRVARQYPSYGLYLYGEGAYAQESRGLKLTGAPVLFLPGNAGSYKQARSLGSVALRKAENLDRRIHMNVFTIDFNEELVALYGGSLRRQTQFLHESIKAILRLYKDRPDPPTGVVLVGHSMGGVVARALFALARFNPRLVSLIITQASPHQAPVLSLDPYILEFYSRVRHRWATSAEELRNVSVLSVGGGYLDFQVRSGLTALSCPIDDLNKMSVVATAVPRSWVSTDHISIVWCKELVLATVRAFFDLIEPETGQFTESPEKRMSVLNYHFFRHPVLKPGGAQDDPITFSGLSPHTGTAHPPAAAAAQVSLIQDLFFFRQCSILTIHYSINSVNVIFFSSKLNSYKIFTVYVYFSVFSPLFCHRQSWFQDVWFSLGLPAVDALPLNSVEGLSQDPTASVQEWPRLVSPLLCVLGASIAFWGSTVLRVFAPQKVSQNSENGFGASDCHSKVKECNGSPLLSESVLQDVRDDLQLHFSLFTLLTFTMMLSVPSLLHWKHNLRYWIHLDPDPCWPHIVPLLISSVLLIGCKTDHLLRRFVCISYKISHAILHNFK